MMSSFTNEKQTTSYRQANRFWKQVNTGLDGKSMPTGLASIHSQASLAQVELSTKSFSTIDEVQHIQRQRLVSFVPCVFRRAYAAMVHTLGHEEKISNCHGYAIQHPS